MKQQGPSNEKVKERDEPSRPSDAQPSMNSERHPVSVPLAHQQQTNSNSNNNSNNILVKKKTI